MNIYADLPLLLALCYIQSVQLRCSMIRRRSDLFLMLICPNTYKSSMKVQFSDVDVIFLMK
jgi:hypothetical protein